MKKLSSPSRLLHTCSLMKGIDKSREPNIELGGRAPTLTSVGVTDFDPLDSRILRFIEADQQALD